MATDVSLEHRVTERLEHLWEEPPGLGSWLGTVDHKRIGKRYIYTAFAFFTAAGIEAMLIRAQLANRWSDRRRSTSCSPCTASP